MSTSPLTLLSMTFHSLFLLQGCIALFLSHCICHFLWSRDYDPGESFQSLFSRFALDADLLSLPLRPTDVYCLPYVSSLVDVIGQALLVLAFATATMLGDNITAAVNAGEGHGECSFNFSLLKRMKVNG